MLWMLTILSLIAGVVSAVPAAPASASASSAAGGRRQANSPKADDFGPSARRSADVAIDGWGDAGGYHLEVGRESSGFVWREVALLRPAGLDASSWTGYQCVSGDGRYAAVAILPASAVNLAAARDHGGFGYSVDLTTGVVRPVATGVGLMYFSPGCGAGDLAVFTLNPGAGQRSTQLLTADLAAGVIKQAVTVPGQVTSAVPTGPGVVGVLGSDLVTVTLDGTTRRLARIGGQPF
jgi:hypothetical protein